MNKRIEDVEIKRMLREAEADKMKSWMEDKKNYLEGCIADLERCSRDYIEALDYPRGTAFSAPSNITSRMVNSIMGWLPNMRVDLLVNMGADGNDVAVRSE